MSTPDAVEVRVPTALHAMALPWHCHGNAMAVPRHCHGAAMALPWHCHAMALPWPKP